MTCFIGIIRKRVAFASASMKEKAPSQVKDNQGNETKRVKGQDDLNARNSQCIKRTNLEIHNITSIAKRPREKDVQRVQDKNDPLEFLNS